jgi:hypothetical protein
VLPQRFARFGLTIHPQKTAVVAVGKPSARAEGTQGKSTFDFLGFPHSWARSRQGYWVIQAADSEEAVAAHADSPVAVVSCAPPPHGGSATPGIVSEAAGALPVFWHPGQLPPLRGGVAARGESLAVLVESPQSERHDHGDQAGAVAGPLSAPHPQDRPQHLRPSAG